MRGRRDPTCVQWGRRRFLGPRKDEGGSMVMFLMVAIMGLALSALLIPMIITQSHNTRLDSTRVHALDAAQAGIEVILGQIRAAADDGAGVSARLPCGPLSGPVNGASQARFAVSVEYYIEDPVSSPQTAQMRCVDGYGTYDPDSGSYTPRYARITSRGTDGTAVNGSTGGRTLVTTYVFKVSNDHIVGGPMRIYPASATSADLCMDAGLATPAVGAVIKMQACANPPAARQGFAYRSDLTIQLLSSVTTTYPNGLCLDTAAPPTAGKAITLAVCSALGSPPYTQQWSFNDSGAYQASLSNSKTTGTLSSQCMNVPSQSAGVQVGLAGCDGNVSSPSQAWIPAPSVGSGAAAAPQLINFDEFGRCLDVTGQNVSANHLIDYPCKQNPNPLAVAWNQQFTTPGIAAGQSSATGQIYTTTGGTKYCLTSPGIEGGYVTVQNCSASNTRQTWTVYGNASLSYSVKYTIVDSGSRCLGLTAPVSGEEWSAVDVEQCTGASELKWNATSDLATSSLQDINEQ